MRFYILFVFLLGTGVFLLSEKNTHPIINKLKVVDTQQGEQGVKQLVVKDIATDK